MSTLPSGVPMYTQMPPTHMNPGGHVSDEEQVSQGGGLPPDWPEFPDGICTLGSMVGVGDGVLSLMEL